MISLLTYKESVDITESTTNKKHKAMNNIIKALCFIVLFVSALFLFSAPGYYEIRVDESTFVEESREDIDGIVYTDDGDYRVSAIDDDGSFIHVPLNMRTYIKVDVDSDNEQYVVSGNADVTYHYPLTVLCFAFADNVSNEQISIIHVTEETAERLAA